MLEDKNKSTNETPLEEVIDNHRTQMVGVDADSEEYFKMVSSLSTLYKIKNEEDSIFNKKEDRLLKKKEFELKALEFELRKEEFNFKKREASRKDRFSPDTLLMVGGNLAGILLILNFEKLNVVTSKALSFVIKLR